MYSQNLEHQFPHILCVVVESDDWFLDEIAGDKIFKNLGMNIELPFHFYG